MAYGFNNDKSKVEMFTKADLQAKRPTYKSNLANGVTLTMVQVGALVIGTVTVTTSAISENVIDMNGTDLPKQANAFTGHTALFSGSGSVEVEVLPIVAGYYNNRLAVRHDLNTAGKATFMYPVDMS